MRRQGFKVLRAPRTRGHLLLVITQSGEVCKVSASSLFDDLNDEAESKAGDRAELKNSLSNGQELRATSLTCKAKTDPRTHVRDVETVGEGHAIGV